MKDRRHAGYVIDCDYAGAWGWVFRPERTAFIGSNCAAGKFWSGQTPISEALIGHFDVWQSRFEKAEFSLMAPGQDESKGFSWSRFHADGLKLAIRLKAELGSRFVVIYSKPYEDESGVAPRNFKIGLGGAVSDYVHRPFWESP